MIGRGMLTLLEHPDQLEQLQAEPALIPDAIEELLRYLTIVHLIILRIATADIEIGGVTIPAGEGIIPLNFAANRDDEQGRTLCREECVSMGGTRWGMVR